MKALCFFIMVLCVSCATNKTQAPQLLQVQNAHGIVMKNKKAITVETKNAGPIAFYVFDAQKVPANRKFYLQFNDEMQPRHPIELISDDYGCLHLATDRSAALRERIYYMQFLLPGEIQSVWLVSEDKNIAVNTTFIPYPLVAYGTDGAEISVVRTESKGMLVQCHGKYFKDQEKLKVFIDEKDAQVIKPVDCNKGNFYIHVVPPNPKSFGGAVSLTIVRENGEVMSLSYPFGRESFNKDALCGNTTKMQDEDYDKLEDAIQCYYKGTSPDALI